MAENAVNEEANENPEPQKKGKSKKLLFVLAGIAVLGIAGAVTFFVVLGGSEAEVPAETEQAADDAPAGLLTMDSFLVNLSGSSGDHYLKLTLRLTVKPAEIVDQASEDDLMRARLRDRVLTVLSSKTVDEIGNPLGKENLRRELQAHLTPLLGDGEVQDVLFSEFVVQ